MQKTLNINEIKQKVISFSEISSFPLERFLDRVGETRLVMLGEASHGTSEFYQMRAHLTKALIEHKGFNMVTLEADWPDAALVNRYVCHLPKGKSEQKAFQRFPQWMWANTDFHEFVEWLRNYNGKIAEKKERISIYGLDLYSLYESIGVVIHYLEQRHPDLAELAKQNYGCLQEWENCPTDYGLSILFKGDKECRDEVIAVLKKMIEEQDKSGIFSDDIELLDVIQNARLIVNAEYYYRTMYDSATSSWNVRDAHMFETLKLLLNFKGPKSKAVVWAHNSHVGRSSVTDMKKRGEINIGELAKQHYKKDVYLIGFGTDHGTVAAASDWGSQMEIKKIVPSRQDSFEKLFHEIEINSFLIHLKDVSHILTEPHLERAIGVIYRPDTELQSHYFQAVLPEQFDEYIWFDETRAVTPLSMTRPSGVPDTYPFGL